jgi:hypothetical protein
MLFREPEKAVPKNVEEAINVAKGDYKVVRVHGDDLNRRLYNKLSGQGTAKTLQGFENKIFIDNRDIVTLSGKQDFFYLCPGSALPLDM